MTPSFSQIARIFEDARLQPRDARRTWVMDACGDDHALRDEVLSLLDHHDREQAILAEPLLSEAVDIAMVSGDHTSTPSTDHDEPAPEHLGPYRLGDVIGEGGMGVVHRAEQTTPVQRTVAIKLIKPGMDSRAMLARFERERDALALMDHPNIARVLDAGTTERSRPYVVMEYVPGQPITRYCNNRNLSIDQRLELFMNVCDAVQHAHHHGVIHRDIKPGNVLVFDDHDQPTPKIIDFGMAKALGGPLDQHTTLTQVGQLIGTPAYMSPEQLDPHSGAIDTRADIYALGVLLYELLCGSTPLDLDVTSARDLPDAIRRIREEEPRRPSTRLAELSGDELAERARNRSTNQGSLARQIRGDLDWIVMRALEKDRTRRYNAVADLVADLRRHRDHEPVDAGPPSTSYRLQKFVRRHRTLVTSAAVVFLVLVAGIVATSVFALGQARARADADAEKLRAEQSANEADAVSSFVERMLGSADPYTAPGPDVRVRDVLDDASREAATTFTDQPMVEARVRGLLGRISANLGLYERSRDELNRAVELRQANLDSRPDDIAPDPYDDFDLHIELCVAYRELGDFDTALDQLERARAFIPSITDHSRLRLETEVLVKRGRIEDDLGYSEVAIETYEEALQLLHESGVDENDPDIALLLNNIGTVISDLGDYERALSYHRDALKRRRAQVPPDLPGVSQSLSNVGSCLIELDQREETLEVYAEALAMRRQFVGDDHPSLATTLSNYGMILFEFGQLEDARTHLVQAVELGRRVLRPTHPNLAIWTANLGTIERDLGNYEESEKLGRQTVDMMRAELGDAHLDTAVAYAKFASMVLYKGREGEIEAEQYLRESLAIIERAVEGDHPLAFSVSHNLAMNLQKQKRMDEAIGYMEEAARLGAAFFGPEHRNSIHCRNSMGVMAYEMRNYEEAERIFTEVLEKRIRLEGELAPPTLSSRSNLAKLMIDLDRAPEAVEHARIVLGRLNETLAYGHQDRADAGAVLGAALLALDTHDAAAEAVQVLQNARDEFLETIDNTDSRVIKVDSRLARALARSGAREAGHALAQDTLARAEASLGPEDSFTVFAQKVLDEIESFDVHDDD